VVKKQKKLYVLAHTTIKPNEEIVIDYSTIIADDDIWKMKCSCGNKNCRKIIGKFSRIPKKLQKEYLTLGVVPEYILAINKN
jgi:hypothetical protein